MKDSRESIEQRPSILTPGVDDLQEMQHFYMDMFGWKPTNHSNRDIVFFHLNGFQLALFSNEALAEETNIDVTGEDFKGFSLADNLNYRLSVDHLFGELKSKGVRVLKFPVETDWGGYSGYVADTEGNLWRSLHAIRLWGSMKLEMCFLKIEYHSISTIY